VTRSTGTQDCTDRFEAVLLSSVQMNGTKVQERSWRSLRVKRAVKYARRSYRHGEETIAAKPLPVSSASLNWNCVSKNYHISFRYICDLDSYRTTVVDLRRGACTGVVLRHHHSG